MFARIVSGVVLAAVLMLAGAGFGAAAATEGAAALKDKGAALKDKG